MSTEKSKFKPVFNIIENITVKNTKTKKTLEFQLKKDRKIRDIEKKFQDVELLPDNFVFEAQHNSISKFIKECHPDIQKLINGNNISKVVANAHKLTIATKNELFITIEVVGSLSRRVIVKDKKRNVLINTITNITHFEKMKQD